MRLIDADAFEVVTYKGAETFSDCFDNGVLYMLNELDKAPTVDAVEVVRCKDCKYSTPDIMSEDYIACWERNAVMPNDGFCSYGKRKEVRE